MSTLPLPDHDDYVRDFRILLGIFIGVLAFFMLAFFLDLHLLIFGWHRQSETWQVDLWITGLGLLVIASSLFALFLWRRLNQALCMQEQIRERLERDEAKYRHLFEHLGEAVFLADAGTGIILEANFQAESLLGRGRDEIVGVHQDELQLPLGLDCERREIADHNGASLESDRECDVVKKNGTLTPVQINTSLLTLNGQQLLLGLFQDLTARRLGEKALRESEQRFRSMFEQAAAGFAHFTPEGHFLLVNEKFCELLGYAREELLQLSMPGILAPEERNRDFEQMRRIAAGEIQTYSRQRRFIRADGSLLWGNLTVSAVREPSGENKYFIAVVVDISDRMEAEAELKRSEDRYRQVVDNAAEAIIVAQDGVIKFANPKALDLSGYSGKELAGMSFLDLIHPDNRERLWQHHLSILEGEPIRQSYEFRIRTREGSTRWVEASAVRIAWAGQPAILGLLTDITERKDFEERYLHARKMEAVGRLAAGVAHDFNNLVGIISGYADLVLVDIELTDPLRQRVEKIRKAAQRAGVLTKQLLAFGRKQILQPEVLSLNSLLSDMAEVLRGVVGERIELLMHLEPELPQVKVDSTQVGQVVMHLAENARNAMPDGGQFIIETGVVELDESYVWQHGTDVDPGPYVVLALSDTGVGMKVETQEHIFEPFFTTKSVGKGNGLGLASTYGTVKQHGGHIWVYSEPGQGCCFKIYLPVTTEGGRLWLEKKTGLMPLSGNETILVVDDDDSLRKLTGTILKGFGYQVLEVPDGESALKLSRNFTGSIDLLLTDVIMPGMNGRELADRLRDERDTITVLYMTGYTEIGVLGKGLLQSRLVLVEKPFSIKTLARKVRQVLDAGERPTA